MPLRDDDSYRDDRLTDVFAWEEKQDRLCYQDDERIRRARMDVYRNTEDETAAKPEKRENIHEEQ